MSQPISKQISEKLSNRALLPLLILLATCFAAMLSQISSSSDLAFSRQIAPALEELNLSPLTHSPPGAEIVSICLYIASIATVVLIAANISRRLTKLNACIASLQLLMLALVFQIGLYWLSGFEFRPTGCLAALVLGVLGGLFWREGEKTRKESESALFELLIRNRELQEARLALVKQDEIERRILAADLHDQVLNDLKKVLELIKQAQENSGLDERIALEIENGFQSIMREVREIMDDLCPVMLQNFGLRAAIEDCLEKGSERAGFECDFESRIEDERLEKFSAVEQSLIYRLVQESITNICKHADATEVKIKIKELEAKILIEISDNGKGIQYEKISHQSRGLRYMRLRAELLDATVEWHENKYENAKAVGTTVLIRIPLPS